MADWEKNINALIDEYLQSEGYKSTLERFRTECKAKKKTPDEAAKTLGDQRRKTETAKIMGELLTCLGRGDRKGFLAVWNANVPKSVREEDVTARQLELNCQMAFAIHPLKHGKSLKSREFDESSRRFKQYLDQRGASLNDLEGFTTYLAFPHVPDPRTCPDFKKFFSVVWDAELKARLEKFLKAAVKPSGRPRLYHLYVASSSSKRFHEAEEKEVMSFERLSRLQREYRNLLDIAIELLSTLEDALSGQMMTPDRLANLVTRVTGHAAEPSTSVDISRPKTATGYMMASLQATGFKALKEIPLLPSLNYQKIKEDLKAMPERNRIVLLQALRWRLTKSVAGEQRDTIMSSYVDHDLLGCNQLSSHHDTMASNLRSKDGLVREYTARLYNTVASLTKGRAYLCQNPTLLAVLVEILASEKQDSLVRQNILGCMQKLSLGRKLQTVMIERGMIEWLIHILQDQDSLSEYSLHYSAALLMNLCLRSSGKKRCITLAGNILNVLIELIEHEDLEIRSYVNGTLYSLLEEGSIKEEAKAMGMEDVLDGLMKSSEPGLASQLEYIIDQLKSDKETEDSLSDDEDEEEDAEEDPEELDVDVDETVSLDGDELTGERLLCERYLGFMSNTSLDIKPARKVDELVLDAPLRRPVTPKIRYDATQQNEFQLVEKTSQLIRSKSQEDSRPRTGASRKEASSRPISAVSLKGRPKPESRPVSRPTTGVSRPSSKQSSMAPVSSKVTHKSSKESLVAGHPQLSIKLSDKSLKLDDPKLDEYVEAFSARPKIPRSPESGGAEKEFVEIERPFSGSPPPPTKSASPPRHDKMQLRSSSRSSSRSQSRKGLQG